MRAFWDAEGVLAAEPASRAEIDAFERANGVSLPDDVRAYFALVNGTRLGEHGTDDRFDVGFWHLDQVRTFEDTGVGGSAEPARTYAFADRSGRIAVYGLRLCADASEPTPVVASLLSGTVPVAPSLTEFFERYLEDPSSVLFSEIDVVAADAGIGWHHEGVVTCATPWSELRMVAVAVGRDEDGSARSSWVIRGERSVSPRHVLVAPVVLTARPDTLGERLRGLPGFSVADLEAARAAERSDEEGWFVCWTHPELEVAQASPDPEAVADVSKSGRRHRRSW